MIWRPLLIALLVVRPGLAQAPKVGNPARDFTLATLDGTTKLRLSQFKGRPVVVSFWASWCPPCRRDMPDLSAAYTAYRGSGLEVLAVNEEPLEVDEKGVGVYRTSQEHRKRLAQFVGQIAMPFPVLLDDAQGGVWSRYGRPWIPAMFFVDTAGTVRAILTGEIPADSLTRGLRTILPLAAFRP